MEKGWNYEYFTFKRNQLEERLRNTNDLKKRKELEEDIILCTYLTTILLFSNDEIIDDKLTFKTFVEEMYGQDFLYKITVSDLKRIKEITLSLSKLPRVNTESYKTHIHDKESIEIVGDFIKDKFDDDHYQSYRNIIISEYTLFDKTSGLSSVTYLDGDIFLRIKKTEDIEMLSSIAHEFGHIYRLLNNRNKIVENSYKEYESFFCEFNFLLWLIKNNIYSKEAVNHFLYLFDTMEKILFMRSFITENQLNQISDSAEYRETINHLHLKKKLHIRKDQDFFNIYTTAINIDLLTYFNSFMAAIHNIDDFDKYEQIVKKIRSGNENDIGIKILSKNQGEYNSYLKYRNYLQNQK